MGRLKVTGFHCPKCDGWGPSKVYGMGKIQLWFQVDGKLWRYCQSCGDQTYAALETRLGAEGKKVRTRQIDVPPQVVVLTDPSDYVEAAALGIEVVQKIGEDDKKKSGLVLPQK